MSYVNFREIDKLGRIVVPMDIRRKLNMNPGDTLKITVMDNSITIAKAENTCVFCNDTEDLIEFNDKYVCRSCAAKLAR